MSYLNLIEIIFSFLTLIIVLIGVLINIVGNCVPTSVQQAYRYGKVALAAKSPSVSKLEVPKSWFKHMYLYSSFLSILTLSLIVAIYIIQFSVPQIVIDMLNALAGHDRKAPVNCSSVLLALSLFTMQCCRRFYETHFVSVFAKNSRMNILHCITGVIHYTGTIFAILLDAPKFSGTTYYGSNLICWSDLTHIQLCSAVAFIWFWWHQHKVTVILANLRKNKEGEVITQKHKLPHGDWFKYVSSPHNLAEILMYAALAIILWGNITWLYVLVFVICNQIETALLTHWWYQEKFPDLPKERMALIPYIL